MMSGPAARSQGPPRACLACGGAATRAPLAASGLILANTLGGVREHLELLKDLGGGGKK